MNGSLAREHDVMCSYRIANRGTFYRHISSFIIFDTAKRALFLIFYLHLCLVEVIVFLATAFIIKSSLSLS